MRFRNSRLPAMSQRSPRRSPIWIHRRLTATAAVMAGLLTLLSSETAPAACDPTADKVDTPCAGTTHNSAETISWEKLSGKTIVLALSMVRRVKVQEDGGVYTDHHDWHFRLGLGPDGALKYSRSDSGYWSDWPGHSKRGGDPARTVSTALGKVHPNPDGRGTAVWTFENGQLIRLSVETAAQRGGHSTSHLPTMLKSAFSK